MHAAPRVRLRHRSRVRQCLRPAGCRHCELRLPWLHCDQGPVDLLAFETSRGPGAASYDPGGRTAAGLRPAADDCAFNAGALHTGNGQALHDLDRLAGKDREVRVILE